MNRMDLALIPAEMFTLVLHGHSLPFHLLLLWIGRSS